MAERTGSHVRLVTIARVWSSRNASSRATRSLSPDTSGTPCGSVRRNIVWCEKNANEGREGGFGFGFGFDGGARVAGRVGAQGSRYVPSPSFPPSRLPFFPPSHHPVLNS